MVQKNLKKPGEQHHSCDSVRPGVRQDNNTTCGMSQHVIETEIENEHDLFVMEDDEGVKHKEIKAPAPTMSLNHIDVKGEHDNEFSLVQQCNFNKGLKVVGEEGKKQQ